MKAPVPDKETLLEIFKALTAAVREKDNHTGIFKTVQGDFYATLELRHVTSTFKGRVPYLRQKHVEALWKFYNATSVRLLPRGGALVDGRALTLRDRREFFAIYAVKQEKGEIPIPC